MRGIFFGLLMSNLLYMTWNILVPEQGAAPVRPIRTASDEAGVVLVAELRPEQLRFFPSAAVVNEVAGDIVEVAASVAAASEEALAESLYCAEIGPFRDEADAKAFAATYAERLALTLDVRGLSTATDYRVFLPPFATRELAASTLEALKMAFAANSLSIDSYLIPRGELANGIALGLFGEQRNALNVQQQLERLGYRVVVRAEPKLSNEYWLLALNVQSEMVFQRQWEQMRLARSYVQAGEKLCETIAQAPQFP